MNKLLSPVTHRMLVSVGLLAWIASFLVASIRDSGIATYLPLIVAVPAVLLSLYAVATDVLLMRSADKESVAGKGSDTERPLGPEDSIPDRKIWFWILMLALTWWVLGTVIGGLAFMTLFMKSRGERMLIALSVAGCVTAFLYFVLIRIAGAPQYRGQLLLNWLPSLGVG